MDHTLTILLGGIAAISLIVGGIGVMNIMLVSVTERIREIGLRKALGATPRVIRRQFLVEASVLGLIGGMLGVSAGLLGVIFLPGLIGDPITTSPTAAVGALAIALAIGVLFGVYPASRAATWPPSTPCATSSARTTNEATRTEKERGTIDMQTPTSRSTEPPALGTIPGRRHHGPRGRDRRQLGGGRRHDTERAGGASGSVAALNASSMEVQNASTGQTTVSWTSTTQFSKTVTEAVSSLAAGDCVTVTGTPRRSPRPPSRPAPSP